MHGYWAIAHLVGVSGEGDAGPMSTPTSESCQRVRKQLADVGAQPLLDKARALVNASHKRLRAAEDDITVATRSVSEGATTAETRSSSSSSGMAAHSSHLRAVGPPSYGSTTAGLPASSAYRGAGRPLYAAGAATAKDAVAGPAVKMKEVSDDVVSLTTTTASMTVTTTTAPPPPPAAAPFQATPTETGDDNSIDSVDVSEFGGSEVQGWTRALEVDEARQWALQNALKEVFKVPIPRGQEFPFHYPKARFCGTPPFVDAVLKRLASIKTAIDFWRITAWRPHESDPRRFIPDAFVTVHAAAHLRNDELKLAKAAVKEVLESICEDPPFFLDVDELDVKAVEKAVWDVKRNNNVSFHWNRAPGQARGRLVVICYFPGNEADARRKALKHALVLEAAEQMNVRLGYGPLLPLKMVEF